MELFLDGLEDASLPEVPFGEQFMPVKTRMQVLFLVQGKNRVERERNIGNFPGNEHVLMLIATVQKNLDNGKDLVVGFEGHNDVECHLVLLKVDQQGQSIGIDVQEPSQVFYLGKGQELPLPRLLHHGQQQVDLSKSLGVKQGTPSLLLAFDSALDVGSEFLVALQLYGLLELLVDHRIERVTQHAFGDGGLLGPRRFDWAFVLIYELLDGVDTLGFFYLIGYSRDVVLEILHHGGLEHQRFDDVLFLLGQPVLLVQLVEAQQLIQLTVILVHKGVVLGNGLLVDG